MSGADLAEDVLLLIGVGLEALAVAGVVAMRDVQERLHYLAPSALGGVLIAAAVWVDRGPSMISLKATILAAILLVASPLLAHAVMRASRLAEHGDWRRREDEEVEAP